MNTILRYGVIVGWGSLLGAASSWASQEQSDVPTDETTSLGSQPAFINIGKVQVPVDALPENILQALRSQQELMSLEITNRDLKIQNLTKQNLKLHEEQEAMDKFRATIQEKKDWISQKKYLDPDCLQKCSAGEIVLVHGFAQQIDVMRKKINQLRAEIDFFEHLQQQATVEYSKLADQIEPLKNQIKDLEQRDQQNLKKIEYLEGECKRLEDDKKDALLEIENLKALT